MYGDPHKGRAMTKRGLIFRVRTQIKNHCSIIKETKGWDYTVNFLVGLIHACDCLLPYRNVNLLRSVYSIFVVKAPYSLLRPPSSGLHVKLTGAIVRNHESNEAEK
jgi:hypothetical protein